MASVLGHIGRWTITALRKTTPVAVRTGILAEQRRHLPVCTVDTNVKKIEVPENFNVQLSKLLAKMLNKPDKLISVVLRTEVEMCRNNEAAPTVNVQIWSVGVFDEERNPAYAKQLFEFLQPALNMPEDRITVFFHPIERKDAGHLLYADMKEKK